MNAGKIVYIQRAGLLRKATLSGMSSVWRGEEKGQKKNTYLKADLTLCGLMTVVDSSEFIKARDTQMRNKVRTLCKVFS